MIRVTIIAMIAVYGVRSALSSVSTRVCSALPPSGSATSSGARQTASAFVRMLGGNDTHALSGRRVFSASAFVPALSAPSRMRSISGAVFSPSGVAAWPSTSQS